MGRVDNGAFPPDDAELAAASVSQPTEDIQPSIVKDIYRAIRPLVTAPPRAPACVSFRRRVPATRWRSIQ